MNEPESYNAAAVGTATGLGHTGPMLQRLLFNLGGVAPETAGGVSNVCQAFVSHIPEALREVESWALTGPGDWDHLYPLSGPARRFSMAGMGSRRTGKALEKTLEPSTSKLGLWCRDRFHRLRRSDGYRFPSDWSTHTVVHCPYQVTHPLPPAAWNLPYVINLHDIQHEHFPGFFTPEELAWRRKHYLASAHHASAVCVVDAWTRRDVLAHLPIPESKVFVAPLGPTWPTAPLPAEEEANRLREVHGLPETFAYYPAQTWPHKNHENLFKALAHLRHSQGLLIPLVLTGHLNEHHSRLVALTMELGIADQVRFLGLIPRGDVHGLFRLARMVVVPSLFEGGPGIPVLEAMALGAPLAAARTCGIPDATEGAALLFDPMDPADMAAAIARLWNDGDLRGELAMLGRARMASWTWERTAATYGEVYREALRLNARVQRGEG